eukprot:Pgem_evm1s15923
MVMNDNTNSIGSTENGNTASPTLSATLTPGSPSPFPTRRRRSTIIEIMEEKYPNERCAQITRLLALNVDIKNRFYGLKSYRRCFLGTEAVQFFMDNFCN